MPAIDLHDLNQHMFAALLPETHSPKALKARAKAIKADEQPAAPQYTAEQLEILKAAGIDDPATADPQTVAAFLGQ
jgi:hypothetical protein